MEQPPELLFNPIELNMGDYQFTLYDVDANMKCCT